MRSDNKHRCLSIKPEYISGALFLVAAILSVFIFTAGTEVALAAKKKTESPKRSIVVKDYKWASAGMGREAILSEITLENRGDEDYQNISIEIDLYSKNGIPMGSLRSTINEIIPAGSEKTFYRVKFGIMHADLQSSTARVVAADLIEKGTPTMAKDLILVKSWEWAGGQYGTEGILKSITLDNKSGENWKDIKIRVDFLGLSGAKVGTSGFTSRAVIHDIIPARSEATFENINVGFRHPDAKSVSITVMSAEPISDKELQYRIAKKEGKPVKKVKVKKTKKTPEESGSDDPTTPEYRTPSGEKLSLSERYKKKLEQEQGITPAPADTAPGTDENIVAKEDTSSGVTSAESTQTEVVRSQDETASDTDVSPNVAEDQEELEEEYEIEYEEEVPLPRDDIVVENFVWGGGVSQTMGKISEITLNNISGISYTKIELKIEFFSYKEEAPMFSNKATIYEILPAKSTRTYRNIDAGFLNSIPQEVRIEVTGAVPFNQ